MPVLFALCSSRRVAVGPVRLRAFPFRDWGFDILDCARAAGARRTPKRLAWSRPRR